jgi:hypothetical protein
MQEEREGGEICMHKKSEQGGEICKKSEKGGEICNK